MTVSYMDGWWVLLCSDVQSSLSMFLLPGHICSWKMHGLGVAQPKLRKKHLQYEGTWTLAICRALLSYAV